MVILHSDGVGKLVVYNGPKWSTPIRLQYFDSLAFRHYRGIDKPNLAVSDCL